MKQQDLGQILMHTLVVYKRNFDGSPEAPSEARWRTDVSAFRTLDSMSQQKVETLFFNVSNQFSFKLILISSKRKNKINKF